MKPASDASLFPTIGSAPTHCHIRAIGWRQCLSLTAEGLRTVTSSFSLTGINRTLLRSGLERYRNALVVIVASVMAIALT